MSREVGSRRERGRDEKRDERRDAKESREESRRKEALKEARRDSRDERDAAGRLDQPQEKRARVLPRIDLDSEGFGVASEKFARFMGTPRFLIWMSVFVVVWLAWNTFAPESVQFDPRSLNYTLLTLILSLQASYAAPLILLAQNRQDDRDRVALEQDRVQAERALADTEYLTREVAALRLALRDAATRDFIRSELRDLLEEMEVKGLEVRRREEDEGGDDVAERVPPVVYDEVLYRHDPPRRDDDLTHYAMLYRREVAAHTRVRVAGGSSRPSGSRSALPSSPRRRSCAPVRASPRRWALPGGDSGSRSPGRSASSRTRSGDSAK